MGESSQRSSNSSWFGFRMCVCVHVHVCVHMPICPVSLEGKSRGQPQMAAPSGYNILLLSLTPHNLHTYTSGFYSRKLKSIVLDSGWLSFSLDRWTGMSWRQLMHFTNQCIDLRGTDLESSVPCWSSYLYPNPDPNSYQVFFHKSPY